MPETEKTLPPKIVVHTPSASTVSFIPRGQNNPVPMVLTSNN